METRTFNIEQISLVEDYINTKIEGDSNLDLCISIVSKAIISILKNSTGHDDIDTLQLYDMTHVLRELEDMKNEIRIIKEGGKA